MESEEDGFPVILFESPKSMIIYDENSSKPSFNMKESKDFEQTAEN